MIRRLTLTKRYLLIVTSIIVVFVTATQFITTAVLKNGMLSLFRQNLDHARSVFSQFELNRSIVRERELDVVLSSPRFMAAMETADSATISQEAFAYQQILSADVMMLLDNSRRVMYTHRLLSQEGAAILADISRPDRATNLLVFQTKDNKYYEFSASPVSSNGGTQLGWIIAGREFSSGIAHELKHLTGLDVVVALNQKVLGHSESPLAEKLSLRPALLDSVMNTTLGQQIDVDGEDVICASMVSGISGVSITFIGSLDEHVAPIRSRITLYLVIMAIAGGALTLVFIYFVTNSHIGKQISFLVQSAETIASGNMDDAIVARSTDEFGFLASEMEKMRSRIVADREAINRAHEERIASTKMAALGQMAAGIIHDFKNPIAIVKGSIEMMRLKPGDSARLDRSCASIEEQTDLMLALAQDILDYSRGRTLMCLSAIDLPRYFESVREFHSASFDSAGIQLTCRGESAAINLDGPRFRRVIDNILTNAREALRPGQCVVLRWHTCPSAITIAIEDNGPGIPESIRASIFEPFVTSGKESGTGLGLAIARKIVEDHGGAISVASHIGTGTTFTITLPPTLIPESHIRESSMAGV
jgi:signal transduction histidine kinase